MTRFRFWLLAVVLLLVGSGAAHAASYAFRSDTYAWESTANTISTWDRTCTGYPVDDDKVTISFTGGFSFTFAGTAYTAVRVMSNGMLQFGADAGLHRDYTNNTLPATAPGSYSGGCANAVPQNVLMGYWMDLKPYSPTVSGGGGTVTWEQKGSAPNRYFVVSWNAVYQYNTTVPYTFQIILYENGEFKYQYGNANASGSNATIGVQVSSTDYTLYSYNSGYNANGTAIRWFLANTTPTRLAEYRMDEYSWTGAVGEVLDSSGNGHNGTAVGAAANIADGYVCRGLDLPANTSANTVSAVDTAVPVSTLMDAQGGISFWVRSDVVWTNNTAAMLFDATTSASRPFFLMRSGGGALKFSLTDSGGTVLTATSAAQTFAAGTWVHVAATWRLNTASNGSVLRLYVNGLQVAVTNGTTTGDLHGSISTLFMGDNHSAGVTPTGGSGNSANGSIDEVRLYNYEMTAVELLADRTVSHSCTPPLHHIELRGSASGLTCTPTTVTVVACQDAACSSPSTSGASGTVTATPAGSPTPTVRWPSGSGAFSIPAGSSSTTLQVQLVTPGTVTLDASGVSPSPSSATTCDFASCRFTAADAGLLFDVPNHYADVAQAVSVKAVRKSDNAANVCVPAFANVSKTVAFGCSYANPATGSTAVQVGSAAVACGGATQGVPLSFDANGNASTTVRYADAGRVTLNATYSGSGADASLSMTGSDDFIAAPKSFSITGLPGSPYTAGLSFGGTVTALNNSGNATPNFGRETSAQAPSMGTSAMVPGPGSAGAFVAGALGSFSAGAAAWSNARWPEVGTLTLQAQLLDYLGSGLGASGTATLRFVPKFLKTDMSVTEGPTSCGTTWVYAGKSFSARVTAYNGATPPVVTGNYSADLTLVPVTTPPAGEGISGNSVTAAGFANGIATATVTYSFASKLTAPRALQLRVTDGDGIASNSPGGSEATLAVRSGRLRLFNAFGSEKSALQMQTQAEYWTGAVWALNSDDSCTTVAATAVAQSGKRTGTGAAGTWTTTASTSGLLAGGRGTVTLSAPSGGSTGTVDIALNLGSGTADQACTSAHPATTGAAVPWLRAQNGSCAAAPDRDPSARATFGIYSPETRKTVHVREVF